VLVVDETGDLKKGSRTAGVQRHYTGTAGRIENAQVAVYLTYAGHGVHALIDRELYLPESWTGDPDRCAGAGIPEDTCFATKPALARQMIARALDAGTPARWAAGMRSTALIRPCAVSLKPAGWATCWRLPAATTSPPLAAASAPMPSPSACSAAPGSGYPQARAPRAPATTTRPGSPSTPAPPRPVRGPC
jgi:hypothetical protein